MDAQVLQMCRWLVHVRPSRQALYTIYSLEKRRVYIRDAVGGVSSHECKIRDTCINIVHTVRVHTNERMYKYISYSYGNMCRRTYRSNCLYGIMARVSDCQSINSYLPVAIVTPVNLRTPPADTLSKLASETHINRLLDIRLLYIQ